MIRLTPKTLTLRNRGNLTLPAELRKKYRLEEGEPLTLIDFDGVFILSPKIPLLPKLTAEIQKLIQEEGTTEDQLLEDLSLVRQKLYDERYGK